MSKVVLLDEAGAPEGGAVSEANFNRRLVHLAPGGSHRFIDCYGAAVEVRTSYDGGLIGILALCIFAGGLLFGLTLGDAGTPGSFWAGQGS